MSKRGMISLMLLLLAGLVALHGCAAMAAVAVVKRVVEGSRHTAKVDLNKSPSRVYTSIVRVMERTPGVVITQRYATDYSVEGTKGKDNIQARAKEIAGGKTELIVIARSREEESVSDRAVAVRVTKDIASDLGVKVEVVEE